MELGLEQHENYYKTEVVLVVTQPDKVGKQIMNLVSKGCT